MKDKLDDEIKVAGLEALVPEELENYLILNSNRLRTFEDARLEIMTYLKAKFGLRIRDSKPSDAVTRGQSNPMGVTRFIEVFDTANAKVGAVRNRQRKDVIRSRVKYGNEHCP